MADKLCENKDNDIDYVTLASQKQSSITSNSKPLIKVGNAQSIYTKLSDYPYE